jgi:branched-chain amino acid transport system substrate-binding protein
MVKAIEKAVFASVRSRFRYGNNHFPIQNFDLQDGVKAPDGALRLKTVATILTGDQDDFHDKCPMK